MRSCRTAPYFIRSSKQYVKKAPADDPVVDGFDACSGEGIKVYFDACSDRGINAFATGNPFCGTNLLDISIGKDFGVLKGLMYISTLALIEVLRYVTLALIELLRHTTFYRYYFPNGGASLTEKWSEYLYLVL